MSGATQDHPETRAAVALVNRASATSKLIAAVVVFLVGLAIASERGVRDRLALDREIERARAELDRVRQSAAQMLVDARVRLAVLDKRRVGQVGRGLPRPRDRSLTFEQRRGRIAIAMWRARYELKGVDRLLGPLILVPGLAAEYKTMELHERREQLDRRSKDNRDSASIPTPFGELDVDPRIGLLAFALTSVFVHLLFVLTIGSLRLAVGGTVSRADTPERRLLPFWLDLLPVAMHGTLLHKLQATARITAHLAWLLTSLWAVVIVITVGFPASHVPFVRWFWVGLLVIGSCAEIACATYGAMPAFVGIRLVRLIPRLGPALVVLARRLAMPVTSASPSRRRFLGVSAAALFTITGIGVWWFRRAPPAAQLLPPLLEALSDLQSDPELRASWVVAEPKRKLLRLPREEDPERAPLPDLTAYRLEGGEGGATAKALARRASDVLRVRKSRDHLEPKGDARRTVDEKVLALATALCEYDPRLIDAGAAVIHTLGRAERYEELHAFFARAAARLRAMETAGLEPVGKMTKRFYASHRARLEGFLTPR